MPRPLRAPTPRRTFLRAGLGLFGGLSLPDWLAVKAAAAPPDAGGRATSAIVLFCWGGLSHLDTFDLKPDAADVRGEFAPIATAAPGVTVCEHLPLLAGQADKLCVVNGVRHDTAVHRFAATWNLTGRPFSAPRLGPPSRRDWPGLGAMVSKATEGRRTSPLPGAVTLPYPIADHGLANGQDGGFLGAAYDPVIAAPPGDGFARYDGLSPAAGVIDLAPAAGVGAARLEDRRLLLGSLEAVGEPLPSEADRQAASRTQALDLLTAAEAKAAFDLGREPAAVRERYGDHVCGRSVLLARRLTEAGVPLVTVNCAAGDLNGSVGAHFDTHVDNFNRLKTQMLPPLDSAASALIADLADRGRLGETLVVILTEFGRTPQIGGGAGRDHFPNCYSVAFAGGGVAGGRTYGRSDRTGAAPAGVPVTPADLHATVFRSLGVDPKATVRDLDGRPFPLCEGEPLPIFG